MPASITNKVEDPCQECRDRHLKCDDNYPKCKQCERSREKCRRGKGKLKFRNGSTARYDSTFAKDQTWLEQTKNAKFQFVDEGPQLENYYSQDDFVVVTKRSNSDDPSPETASKLQKRADSSDETERSPTVRSEPLSEVPSLLSPQDTGTDFILARSPFHKPRRYSETTTTYGAYTERQSKPAYDPPRDQYIIYTKKSSSFSPDGYSPMSERKRDTPKVVLAEYRRIADTEAGKVPDDELLSPEYFSQFYWPNDYTTNLCVCLMRYFIEVLAPWFDVGDPGRHFEKVVPENARQSPPLLNAIFTLSARHLASNEEFKDHDRVVKYQNMRLTTLNEHTAVRYDIATIKYLRVLSQKPEYVHDENLLAAAVIQRQYAMIDPVLSLEDESTSALTLAFRAFVKQITPYAFEVSDEKCQKFLRPGCAPGNFTNATQYLRSFQHASFRVALRQEITMAFLKEREIQLPLATWAVLESFDQAEDFIWADRHLYHCAKVLQYCYSRERMNGQIGVERWRELKGFEQLWDKKRPSSFMPMRDDDSNLAENRPLPQIWYLSETHVAGLCSLDLARILLRAYDPARRPTKLGISQYDRILLEDVRRIVLRLCGTAISLRGAGKAAPSSQPAMIQAYLAVMMCMECFHDPIERGALFDILKKLNRDYGWPTDQAEMRLRREWHWPPFS